MAITVMIPAPLRRFAGDRAAVRLEGRSVGEALRRLVEENSSLCPHLYDPAGRLRSFVTIFRNDADIRGLSGEDTPLQDGDTLTILPSVAGGSDDAPPTVVDLASRGRPELDHAEVRRYSRHLIMPEVGMEGQRKLKAARVLCIGTGGLGSPVSMYLAAAGVGHLTLVDFDVVDTTNLQRQVLYTTADVGRPKLEAARDRLHGMNPHITLELVHERLTSANAMELVRAHDVVVDGTDNFPTRYLSNDACVLAGKPNVYGSIFRFDGQVSVFYPGGGGPCYRCLYPEPPPPGLVPSCAEGGVLGILPGVIGCLQATECIKLILGKGRPLLGRLLLFDALEMEFRELRLRRNPRCPVCGDDPTIDHLVDYEQFCGLGNDEPQTLEADWEISAAAAKARMDAGDRLVLLDVREPAEWEICRIEGARLIPLGELAERVGELDTATDIVVHCKSGRRSAKAVRLLREMGFMRVKNLTGGIEAWAEEVDPSLPRY